MRAQGIRVKVIENNLKIDPKLSSKLDEVNILLWQIEDKIRFKETLNYFDDEFVQIARSFYHQNHKMASLKREINSLYNSQLIEENIYQ